MQVQTNQAKTKEEITAISDLVLIQQDITQSFKGYCHEWQQDGDTQPFWGFGKTLEEAEKEAVYNPIAAERDEGRGFSRGLGDWQTRVSIYRNQNGWACHTQVELFKNELVVSSF